jgi:AraC-like DNA-binding protein
MKRAVELFTFERRSSRSPLVEQTWQTCSEPAQSFISVAVSHWEMVVTRQRGTARLTVRGPETKATTAPVPEDAEFFGIQFSLGTFMPGMPPGQLADSGLTLPQATSTSFWLDGARWELPGPDNADVFTGRLARAGLLAHDPVVPAAVQGDMAGLSRRSVERRVSRATGLTLGGIGQIRRAERAVGLLRLGLSPLDVADQAGYADQSHLTRSLQRFVGRTPSQIAAAARRLAVVSVQDSPVRPGPY